MSAEKKLSDKFRIKVCQLNKNIKNNFSMTEKDANSLEHTKWRCQYHIVFAPKYHRQVLFGVQKGIEIIEANAYPEHIHMLISIPKKYSVLQIMRYLEGKSDTMIFDGHINLKV